MVDNGWHGVAAYPNTGAPFDANGDGIPNVLSDTNGDGIINHGEINWITGENKVQSENVKPGTTNWMLTNHSSPVTVTNWVFVPHTNGPTTIEQQAEGQYWPSHDSDTMPEIEGFAS